MRNLVGLGPGGKFLQSLLWQELGVSTVTGYDQQHGRLKETLSLPMPFLWSSYRSDKDEKTQMRNQGLSLVEMVPCHHMIRLTCVAV